MAIPAFLNKGIRPILALALAGAFAPAQTLVSPLVGNVAAGRDCLFEVSRADGTVPAGVWTVHEKDASGAWKPVGPERGGRVVASAAKAGHYRYHAPATGVLAVFQLWFTPQDTDRPERAAVRVFPELPQAPTGDGAEAGADRANRRRKSAGDTGAGDTPPARPGRRSEPTRTAKRPKLDPEASPAASSAASSPAASSTPAPTEPAAAPAPPALPPEEGEQLQRGAHRRVLSRLTDAQRVTFADDPSRSLGAGAAATVTEVDVEGGGVAAAKRFEKRRVNGKSVPSQEERKAMLGELEVLRQFRHPNIIKYLGFRETAREYCIILELAKGSLEDEIERQGHLPEPMIKAYTRQLLEALACLHEKHWVHADLKSKNVLIATDGVLKLADFGCARSCAEGKVQLGPGMGGCTPLWAAPELLDPEAGFNEKADLWSLGCVILEMLTGQDPWAEHKFTNVWRAAFHIVSSNELPAIPDGTPEPLRRFVLRCLTRDPEARPGALELLQDPWLTGGGQ